MNYSNLFSMLKSKDPDRVVKALMILYNNPKPEFLEEIKDILNKKQTPLIKSLATKSLSKIESLMTNIKETESNQFLDMSFIKLNLEKKLKLLKEIKIGHKNINISPEALIDIYLAEKNQKIIYILAEVITKNFPSQILSIIDKIYTEVPDSKLIYLLLLNVFLKNEQYLDEIISAFNSTSFEPFMIAASKFIWEKSKIIVVKKLKELAESPQTPKRITASYICKFINSSELKGIILHLAEDPNEIIKANSKAALMNLPESIEQDIDIIQNDSEIYKRFENVLTSSSKFQEKISVIKALDNLCNGEYIEIVSANLLKEQNPFLISAYVKYLGKYGGEKYRQLILPYLEHSDPRVVSNCIEGLGHCDIQKVRNTLLLYIKDKHHRIASCAAVELWKNGEKEEVKKFLNTASSSKKLWKRKSALHILNKLSDPELKNYYEILLKDKNSEIRDNAKKALSKKEEPKVQKKDNVIIHLLETGKLPQNLIKEKIQVIMDSTFTIEQRLKAVRALGFMISNSETEIIKDLFSKKELPNEIKLELIKIIGIITVEPVSYFVSILPLQSNSIKSEILKYINDYDCEIWIDELYPYLFEEDVDVILNCAILLYKYIPSKVEKKIKQLVVLNNIEIKKKVLNTINIIGSSNLFQLALYLLKDKNTDIVVLASSITANLSKKYGFKLPKENSNKDSIADISKSKIEPFEIINSLENTTEISIISEKIDSLISVINESHIESILSIMETSKNPVLVSKLSFIFGKFSSDEKIVKSISKFLLHSNERIASNVIESLISSRKCVCFNLIFDMIPNVSSNRIRTAIFKLMFSNPIYRNELLNRIETKDYDNFILSIMPKNISSKIEKLEHINSELKLEINKVNTQLKEKEDKIKDMTNIKSKIKNKVEIKPVKNTATLNALPKTVEKKINTGDNNSIKILINIVSIIIIIFAAYYMFFVSSRETDTDIVETVDKTPEILTKKINKGAESSKHSIKKVKIPDIGIKIDQKSVNLNTIIKMWQKIGEKENIPKKVKRHYLIKTVDILQKNYFRGEFSQTIKFLKANNFSKAMNSLTKVIKALKSGKILWNTKTREWITRDEMQKRILKKVKENQ